MHYVFKPDKSLPANLGRVARSQVAAAIAELAELPEEDSVHQVRKRCKKLRALLRLVRHEAEKLYRYENAQFRTIANTLSASRDAVSLRDALLKLAPGKYPQIEALLSQQAEHKNDSRALDDARLQLQQAAQRFEAWPLKALHWKHARRGYAKSYRRARKSMQQAFAEESAENFHEFRKRVKDHWYHSRLMGKKHKKHIGKRRKPLKKLAKALGDWRDLHLLCRHLAPLSAQFPGELIPLLDTACGKSDELHGKIAQLSADLFGPKKLEC
ncbi:CHAD domain-containing protein [Microbulbifer guangxiensis]|uniref:CHAD domain-containing protein n=1 Tax=Microbulbifer guangxiensis TaxID=2904249 RepID=UPI001F45ED87|nr:CHAD domain-containing protein [Microbulbifer guangxiensis]